MKSIIQKEKRCLICGTTNALHDHHVFFGSANRKQSEKYGMKVWLCYHHHNGSNDGVHFNRDLDLFIKRAAQNVFEKVYGTRKEFMQIFGKNYL